MCYAVIVITEVCEDSHQKGGTIAWRQCKTQALLCKEKNIWNTLCEDTDEDQLLVCGDDKKLYTSSDDCYTCKDIKRIVTSSELQDEVIELEERKAALESEKAELTINDWKLDREKPLHEARIEELNTEIAELEPKIEEMNEQLDSITQELSDNHASQFHLALWEQWGNRNYEVFYYGCQNPAENKEEAVLRAFRNDRPEVFPPLDPAKHDFSLVYGTDWDVVNED